MNRTIASFLLLVLASLPTGKSSKAHANGIFIAPNSDNAPALDAWKQDMLDQVNAIRAKGCRCGRKSMPAAPRLRWNNDLEKTAARHVADMKAHDFIGHTGSNGSRIGDRVSKSGYDWRAVAENVAWGTETVSETVQGWKDSPGHCLNIMNKIYKDFGAAWEGDYWAQVFATKM